MEKETEVRDLEKTLCRLERMILEAEEEGNSRLAGDVALKADQIRRRLREILREGPMPETTGSDKRLGEMTQEELEAALGLLMEADRDLRRPCLRP